MSSDPPQPAETVTIAQILEQQSSLESEAAEVLPFDITRCSRPLGPIRQPVYSCLTCNPVREGQDHLRAGVCSSCSVSCHGDHQLVELFVRRKFVCDCGTSRCNAGKCQLSLGLAGAGEQEPTTNKYDHNFDGQFCFCERGKKYDPQTETEDMYQCLACEDWRHASCLGPHPDPDNWDDLICAACVGASPTLRAVLRKHAGGEGTGMMVCGRSEDGSIKTHGKLLPTDHESNQASSSSDSPGRPQNRSSGQDESNEVAGSEKDGIASDKRPRSDLPTEAGPAAKRHRPNTPISSSMIDCTAPFQNESDSPLSRVDPGLANVYLASGWRYRWCKCLACQKSLSESDWLVSEEEEVWEPEADEDSQKSLHELGIEAFGHLPRAQMVEGLHAYNRLRDEMMSFLQPFAATDTMVTEEAIREFFASAKQKIQNKNW